MRSITCRNRHCPKCQTLAKEEWLEARRADLLPVPYVHVVFTLPHALNPLAQGHPRLIYRLLFQAAADTLLTFGRDPKWLGGELGITMVLHTWGQNLEQHLHVHGLVTGGALSPDGQRWIPAKPGFLFPVRALSRVFRGKYLGALKQAFGRGELHLTGEVAPLTEPAAFDRFLATLRQTDWVVYAKPPLAGPEEVLEYLGRYTHRTALSNDRLVELKDDGVRFRWKDYAHGNRIKVMTLLACEFIRRFLLHVLPPGFMRIRHLGLLANRCRGERLACCRALLNQPAPVLPEPESLEQRVQSLLGIDIRRCPHCRSGMLRVIALLQPAPIPVLVPNATGPP